MTIRLDVWLDVACLFPTRSEAQRACKGGKVDLNGHTAKPNRDIKPGDVIEITRTMGRRRQRVLVKGLAERHIPKAEARLLYEDTTPPPSPEEQQLIDLLKLAGPRRRTTPQTPDRRERRRLRRAKEGEGD
jgi:ribosome-associated heat shock protein Hsp15